MRYYKGYISLSNTSDVPVLLHIRNARALSFIQLRDLLSFDLVGEISRSLRWRVARLEKAGLIKRLEGYRHIGTPLYGVTRVGLEFLESRGHYLLSLPSNAEPNFHASQIPHALELANIRIALARASLLHSWRGDLEVGSRNLVIENPMVKDYDAVAEIEIDGTTRSLGIEYERTPKAVARYRAIREVLDKDETTDLVLYLTSSDDLLYLLATEMRGTRKRIGFALSESFRHFLLDTRTLTNTNDSDVVPLRDLLASDEL